MNDDESNYIRKKVKFDNCTPMAYFSGEVFEWDSVKSQANIKKHGLSFEEASEIFKLSENLILEEYDFHHSINEDRIITIGPIARGVIVVFSVERASAIRLISARFATTNEKERYCEVITRMQND